MTWVDAADARLAEETVVGASVGETLFDLASGEPLEGPADEPVRAYRTRVVGDRVEIDIP